MDEESFAQNHSDCADAGNDSEDDRADKFHGALLFDENTLLEFHFLGGHGSGYEQEVVLHRLERDGDNYNDACRCASRLDDLRGGLVAGQRSEDHVVRADVGADGLGIFDAFLVDRYGCDGVPVLLGRDPVAH